MFTTAGLQSGLYNNFNNIISTLNHERALNGLGHISESDKIRANYTFSNHANIYLNEATNQDFSKTTDEYKTGQANGFINHALKASENDGVDYRNSENNYNNSNSAGVTIIGNYGPMGDRPITGTTSIILNGQSYTPKSQALNRPED